MLLFIHKCEYSVMVKRLGNESKVILLNNSGGTVGISHPVVFKRIFIFLGGYYGKINYGRSY
jgi:hypothetical protein